jgi:hypothetical protein
MYSLIREWESSGTSQLEFFKHHQVARSTFGYWRKKYLSEKNSKAEGQFISVKIADTVTGATPGVPIELHYPNGVRLVCSSGMDLARLKPLIVL